MSFRQIKELLGLVVIEDLGTAIVIAGALVCMMIAAEVPWKYPYLATVWSRLLLHRLLAATTA